MKIILGSKSVRRKELMEYLGYDFIVDFVETDELVNSYKNPKDYAKQVVTQKAKIISRKYPNDLVICADTIVAVDNQIINKPKDIDDCRRIINTINNKTHEVYTSVFIKYKNYKKIFTEKTLVTFDLITSEEIEAYIKTAEPYDKAGGYAIQGTFAKYVKKINGDFYNVMGLPLNKLNNEIKKIVSLF